METQGVWGVTNAELESAVAAVDRTAFLVPPRIVRRVLRHDRKITDTGLRLPHRKTFFVRRESLLEVVDPPELGLASAADVPEMSILLSRPEAEQLSAITRPRVLLKYWRLLFHCRVHVELERLIVEERLTPVDVRRRIGEIGRVEFEEIRTVLKQESLLLPPVDETSIYVEFASVYLELKYFAPRLLADYFPSIRDFAKIDAILARDFDAPRWFEATRLGGAPEPHEQTIEDEEALTVRRIDPAATNPRKQSERLYCRLMNLADTSRTNGNDVRSSIMRWWAALRIGPKLARTAREHGREDLHHLADRLAAAVSMSDDERNSWRELLAELLPVAARGIWTPETRFLYDLQKVCLDHERGIFQLDVVGWLKSFGRAPLKRELPNQRVVLISKHLSGALQRVPSLRMTGILRDKLTTLLKRAVERAEHDLREAMRPRLEQGLDDVGLVATNRPEVIARKKLVEELLDRVVKRGFFNLSDLRDAIANNNLKLRDITEWRELWSGDEALRADATLGARLDGVYRRGELYRRIPQWLSSAAFGTLPGRLITKYGVVPFGGAYFILMFVEHLVHAYQKYALGIESEPGEHQHHLNLVNVYTLGLLGVFIIMLYSPNVRAGCAEILRGVGRLFVDLFVVWPKRVLQAALVRQFMRTPVYRALQQYFFKPLVTTLVLFALLWVVRWRMPSWPGFAAVFVVANLLVNSKWGRAIDEWLTDFAHRSWHQLRLRVFTTIAHAIMEFFHEALEAMERVLYAVDEWLRFRTGESRTATVGKAVLAFFWFFINYFVRFAVTLLIEPQINPIKHFPVVTVSHKIILPLAYTDKPSHTPSFLGGILMWIFGLDIATANWVAVSVVWLIPGIFGYAAWELRSNWSLYDANRPENLKPVIVGDHGESIVRLLRWGFHSGTTPKTYAKLRRADRKAQALGAWDAPRKYRSRLEDVFKDVKRLVERDLVQLLAMSEHANDLKLKFHSASLGITHIRVSLAGRDDYSEPLTVTLHEKAGWLIARMETPAWYDRLSLEQNRTLTMAVMGFYKMCGVDFVVEQIEKCFVPELPRYDFNERGLVVWTDPDGEPEATYDLRRGDDADVLVSPSVPCTLPTLDRQRLFFAANPIRWTQWVEMWETEDRRSTADAGLPPPDVQAAAGVDSAPPPPAPHIAGPHAAESSASS